MPIVHLDFYILFGGNILSFVVHLNSHKSAARNFTNSDQTPPGGGGGGGGGIQGECLNNTCGGKGPNDIFLVVCLFKIIMFKY